MQQQSDWKYQGEMVAAKEKAMKEGSEEGVIEIATNLKVQGMDLKQIFKIKGLKIEEIKEYEIFYSKINSPNSLF